MVGFRTVASPGQGMTVRPRPLTSETAVVDLEPGQHAPKNRTSSNGKNRKLKTGFSMFDHITPISIPSIMC